MDHKLRLYVYWPMLFAGLYIMAIYLFDDSESQIGRASCRERV